jgi:ABC-type dipeptide/oligopeptide/nickel transport system permease subunit
MGNFWRRFFTNRLGLAGSIIVGVIVVLALAAPWIAPYDPAEQGTGDPLSSPNISNWFGTDELGRDIFTRVVYAGQIAVLVGTLSTFVAAVIGIPFGLVTGYYGGWLDSVMMRITDAWLAFPIMVLALAISAAMGPGLTNAIIAIGFVSIPNYIRLARGQTLVVKSTGYVEAALVIGQIDVVILNRYVLPNISSVLIVQSSLTAAAAILTESALSFLGVGVMPPTPSWGAMLSHAMPFLTMAPWMAIAPGVAIFLLVMGINLLGDGLRDALDPKIYR